jgi:hypothetical protein
LTFWAQVFLGVIAVATLVMALVQVSVMVYGWMLARKMARIIGDIEREMATIMDSLNAVARDAARATALAAVQVERVDRLFSDLTSRVEQTAATIQNAILAPLREGAAVMAGFKAVMALFRDLTKRQGASSTRSEEEDALFIG